MSVRVRFAPSPTGLLHIGALRTVLFDDLFARHHGGVNILRIEDTDRSRYNPESEAEFIETLRWVGIEFQEGPHVGGPHAPYRQSERQAAGIYARLIDELIGKGHAYRAFETPEELEEMREMQQINKRPVGYYGGDWRDADSAKVDAAIAEGKPFVVRMKVPRDRTVTVRDAIRDRVEFDTNTLPDPVLLKADGMPTYHFAAIVDDKLMGITHVFRGEEWISSAPYHWLLIEAFGWDPPIFVHCPVILGSDNKKLSKRHGATRVLDYMAQGYLKSALKNFIALIGWSPGTDEEVLTDEELVEKFDLAGLQPSPGRFDIEKLKWLNGHRIRSMTPEAVLGELENLLAEPYVEQYWSEWQDETGRPGQTAASGREIYERFARLIEASKTDREYVLRAIKESQERVSTLIDFGEACEFFILDEPPMDANAVEKWFGQPHVEGLLGHLKTHCGTTWTPGSQPEDYKAIVTQYQATLKAEKLGPLVNPIRVALTGKTSGPGLFELMAVLGPDRIRTRLDRATRMLAPCPE